MTGNIARKPLLGTLFVVLAFIVSPLIHFSYTVDPVAVPRYFFLAGWLSIYILMFLLATRYSALNFEVSVWKSGLTISILAYTLLTGLSLYYSINFYDALFDLSKVLLYLIYIIVLHHLISQHNNLLYGIIKGINISAIVLIGYGLWQFYELRITGEYLLQEISINYIISSTLANKHVFAVTLLLILPYTFLLVLLTKSVWKLVGFITCLSVLSSIILLQSLSTWIALILSSIITLLLLVRVFTNRKDGMLHHLFSRKRLIIVAIIVLTLGAVFYLSVKTANKEVLASKIYSVINESPVQERASSSIYERSFLLKNTLKMIAEKPLTGSGLSNWKLLYHKYGVGDADNFSKGTTHFQRPHNDYLWIAAESGMISLLAYILIFAIAIWYILKIVNHSSASVSTKILMAALLFNIISFFLISFFSFPKERIFPMMIILTSLTIVLHQYLLLFPNSKPLRKRVLIPLLFVFLLVTSGCIVIGHYRINGEKHLKIAVAAQRKSNWPLMQREIYAAHSVFFNIDPASTPLDWYKGLNYFYTRNIENALRHFNKALEVHPNHIHILNSIGSCYSRRGEQEKAIEYYKKALAINPVFNEAILNLSVVYHNAGLEEEAYGVILNYVGKHDIKYQRTIKAILQSKTLRLIQKTDNETLKEFLKDKSDDKNWLYEMHQDALKNKRSFETELSKLI